MRLFTLILLKLLLTIQNESCYFSYIPGEQQHLMEDTNWRTQMEANVTQWIEDTERSRIWPTTLDQMRKDYNDLLANFMCTDKNVYILTLYTADTAVFSCDFESRTSPLCGMTQDSDRVISWLLHNDYTQTHSTGPARDHTCGTDRQCSADGYYMYIETSYVPDGEKAHLYSPRLNVDHWPHHCLRFYYHMYGTGIGTLNVYVLDPDSHTLSTTPVWSQSGNRGTDWHKAEIDIDSTSTFQVVFEGVKGQGAHSDLGDIAVDDIVVFHGPCDTHPDSGLLRLVGGSGPHEGRVEVMIDGRWGTVCGVRFDVQDAIVVCRMLGYHEQHPAIETASFYGQGSGHVLMNFLECNGGEASIFRCKYTPASGVRCMEDYRDVGVNCQPSKDFHIRLVDGPSPSEGRVEVYIDGRWGTVCDHSFHEEEAKVICRTLGYSSNSPVVNNRNFYGHGNTTVLLDHVDCQGDETSILDCSHSTIGAHNCRSAVGVTCQTQEQVLIGRDIP